MNTAKDWWRNNSDEWLKKTEKWEKQDKGNSKHYIDEENFLIDNITGSVPGNYKILEVGSGNGRIIGKLSKIGFKCCAVDINPVLAQYVASKYSIDTVVSEIIALPFEDNEFDLVYTHEVLQHICPEEIDKACEELKRVGKEVWCLENWRSGQSDGEMVSDSHSGRWNYDLKKRFNIYEDFYTDWGQLFIKSKK